MPRSTTSPSEGEVREAGGSGSFASAKNTITSTLAVALVGSMVGLTAGRWWGGVSGAEVLLNISCALFSSGILLVLLLRPFDQIRWVAPASSIYFLLYLTAGALLTFGDNSVSFLIYLNWFFPLLAFNRFVNVSAVSGYLSGAIYSSAVLLALGHVVFNPGEAGESLVLIVYILSVTAFALILGLFARYREAYIKEQERTLALESMHRAIRQSEERFRELFDNAASGIGWVSMDGRCLHVNSTFGKFVGRDPHGLQETPFGDLVHPEDRAMWADLLEEMRRGERNDFGAELRLVDAEGRRLWTRLTFGRVESPGGEPAELAFVCLDDTVSHEMEARLQQAQRLDAVGQLTGGIAHDFNNLLTVIIGSTDSLERELPEGGELAKLAGMARAAAEHGAKLTSHLLAFSRRQALEPKLVEVGTLISNMMSLLKRTLGERIQIDLVSSPDLWPALADPVQLESAVLNLGINARDAMPDGGRLLLELHNIRFDDGDFDDDAEVAPGEYVLVAVTDTGIGIPPDVLPRVFEPFFTTKGVGEGNGLGLSMIYGFAKQSRGHVRIYSEVGHGTTVKLFLPRTATDELLVDSPALPVVELPHGSATLLVVEDNDLVRALVVKQLQRLGYQVITASNGVEALEVLRTDTPVDLMFTDIVMPGGIDGLQLIERARDIRGDLRVLVTSGYTQDSVLHAGRTPPGVALLSKPYRMKNLAESVAVALSTSE